MTEELKTKNFATIKRYLISLVGGKETETLIAELGGEGKITDATFGMTTDSGSAYDGAFGANVLNIAEIAKKINAILPQEKQADVKSIYKVAILQHISKVIMYEKNDNDWEVQKRGILYKFNNFDTALRGGERSLLFIMRCGIQLTEDEFEAIRILDKQKDDDTYSRIYSSPLSVVIRQANEINTLINRE